MNDKGEATWQYEVDSVQRSGTTEATLARRHGEVTVPEPSDGPDPNNLHSEKGGEERYDDFGIPTGDI